MKKKSTSQSALFNLRVLIGLFVFLAGVFLALLGFGTFSNASAQPNATQAQAQEPRFDCRVVAHAKAGPFVISRRSPATTGAASQVRRSPSAATAIEPHRIPVSHSHVTLVSWSARTSTSHGP
jgi:hypothetical protein